MIDLALVTCVDQPDGHVDDHALARRLAARGLTVEFACWDDTDVQWGLIGAVVVRSTWDYHLRPQAFTGWAQWVGSVTRLHNPAATVAWNVHKRYLLELEAAGVPIVPTTLVPAGGDLVAATERFDGQPVVVKPAVSLGAHRTERQPGAEQLAALGDVDVLVQPYLDEVATDGEISVVAVGGVAHHAVRKVPAPGDFRTQPSHGATVRSMPLSDALAAAAHRALAAVPGPVPTYARVDLVPTAAGLQLMELELIEPLLWLADHPDTAEALADAVTAGLGVAVEGPARR